MRSTNINLKRGILFSICLLFCLGSSSTTATISADWPEGEGERERKGERRKERRVRGDGFWDSIPWPRWK